MPGTACHAQPDGGTRVSRAVARAKPSDAARAAHSVDPLVRQAPEVPEAPQGSREGADARRSTASGTVPTQGRGIGSRSGSGALAGQSGSSAVHVDRTWSWSVATAAPEWGGREGRGRPAAGNLR